MAGSAFIQINLGGRTPTVVTFDGQVLECFFVDASTRVHIIHIRSIELTGDGAGNNTLAIQLKYKNLCMSVDERVMDPALELVAEVKRAMAAYSS